jgi:uncharacterized protein YacL
MAGHDPARLRRARRIARLSGAVVGLVLGVFYGVYIIPNSAGALNSHVSVALAALLGFAAMGLVFGSLAGPMLSVEPYLWLESALDTAPPFQLISAAIGLIVALVVGLLVTLLLSALPNGTGYIISVPFTCALVYIVVGAAMRRRSDLLAVARQVVGARANVDEYGFGGSTADLRTAATGAGIPVLLDTSALIDGRVLDVAQTGFLPGRLLIPGFVLEELQRIADAGDHLRRVKGRRGLHVVEQLQQSRDVACEVIDADFPGTPEVDSRLVRLARARSAAIMTNDHILNRLARIEGVRVLNINELANALKPIVASGETLRVTLVKEGREHNQGIGYLDDGTMVVVENGRRHIDEEVTVTVTSVLQTAAGRLIFAQVPEGEERRPRTSARTGARLPRVAKS